LVIGGETEKKENEVIFALRFYSNPALPEALFWRSRGSRSTALVPAADEMTPLSASYQVRETHTRGYTVFRSIQITL
jgi:hypothetical protein